MYSVLHVKDVFSATHLMLSGKQSSIISLPLTLTFLSMPLSPVCLQTERFERHFLFAPFYLPSWGNGAGCVQAINATTMPKVVICHTLVRHNHYMECNAPKLPSRG